MAFTQNSEDKMDFFKKGDAKESEVFRSIFDKISELPEDQEDKMMMELFNQTGSIDMMEDPKENYRQIFTQIPQMKNVTYFFSGDDMIFYTEETEEQIKNRMNKFAKKNNINFEV